MWDRFQTNTDTCIRDVKSYQKGTKLMKWKFLSQTEKTNKYRIRNENRVKLINWKKIWKQTSMIWKCEENEGKYTDPKWKWYQEEQDMGKTEQQGQVRIDKETTYAQK